MDSLDDLLSEELILRTRLEKYIENGKKTPIAKRTLGFFETRREELKKMWREYSAIDMVINKSLIKLKFKEPHVYLTANYYTNMEVKYSDYLSDLTEGLNKLSATTSSPDNTAHTPSTIIQESTLPRISLPTFNGNYDNWRAFHDLFASLVHNNNRLTPVQKLHHLKSCLVGDAEQILRHIPVTDQDYEPAWIKLINRFENTRILVKHQLRNLTEQPKLHSETARGLKSLVTITEECIQQIKSLNVYTKGWDPLLIHIITQKLPFQTLKAWEEELGASKDLPLYEQFQEFLDTRTKVLESIADATASPSVAQKSSREKTFSYHTLREGKCPACSGKHWVTKCPRYKGLEVSEKRKILKGHCLNCLSSKHITRNCTSKYRCFKCKQAHHTSLHEEVMNSQEHVKAMVQDKTVQFRAPQTSNSLIQPQHTRDNTNQIKMAQHNPQQTSSLSQSSSVQTMDKHKTIQTFISNENVPALLATALVQARTQQGTLIILRCLIDPGSQSSFITEAACKRLHAVCTPTEVTVKGVNSIPAATAYKCTRIQLRPCGSDEHAVEEDCLVIRSITNQLPRVTLNLKNCKHLNNLQLADPTFHKPGKIDVLLGANAYAKIIQEGIKRGSDVSPVAINTLFGWILLGPTNHNANTSTLSFSATTTELALSKQLQKFWEIEEVSIQTPLTKEEEDCQTLYQYTHKRLENGKYQVTLPFLDNKTPELGESRPQALKRFHNLQKRFTRNLELHKEYTKCLNEYIQLGHMEEVEPPKNNEVHYYIPHHAVFKESSTTKVRVVFDASSKTTNGNSLNQHMLKGPTLQPKLFSTLLNWRKYRIAMNADIEKMYRMIEVNPEQRTFQRIVWQHPVTGKIQDYQLTTVTFGTTSAPYLAARTLLQLAEDESDRWPLAAQITKTQFYVDDLLTGADNVTEAKLRQKELINMLRAGGFNLRKWASNHSDILASLPPEHREIKGTLSIQEDETIKTLGIQWHPAADVFTFKLAKRERVTQITKRAILSEVASLYDPLGWLAPIIINAKILMQTLWISGCSWDDSVSNEIEKTWNTFIEELNKIKDIKIPRWINYSSQYSSQLHGFCDASARAYAAVLYLRVETERGDVVSNLLTAKTKVAPIKPTTIPRLELNGAVLLTKLVKTTIQDMQFDNIPITLWTDSMIVLQWIAEHPARWKTYVANRVVEIQDIAKSNKWRHISSKDNPADLASRGISPNNLVHNKLWWNGPAWLVKPQENWPNSCPIKERTTLEARELNTFNFHTVPDDSILLKYSSYTQLIRITALLRRFIHNCKYSEARQTGQLSIEEYQQAEAIVLRTVQQIAFPEDYRALLDKKPLPQQSRFLQLNPFLDDNKVIRVGGRLTHAMLSYNQRHPIIVPKGHHVTSIMIDKLHLDTLHGGTALVLATSRNKYWILDARRAITRRIHGCVACTRHRKVITTQQMSDLPKVRVNISKPFTKVGIDYAGPINIRASRCRKAKILKAYICIFVCMVTRAIHIELVSSLEAEAFIAALKRFIARRGLCTDIYSDCGTNFIGGRTRLDKDLKAAIKAANPEAAKYLVSRAIQWHFNPPGAPHFGGIWEAGVKSVKHHLYRTLGNTQCTFEEYTTILTQIESCLNSRPLCYIANDPAETTILTPGHFLIGQALNATPEPNTEDRKIVPSQRWRYLQERTNYFWRKWSKDYLNQLQTRTKWQTKQRNMKIGDIVLIKSENAPPNNWPLGIIIRVFPGADGLIRVAEVKTQHGSMRRPISKLCRLPTDPMMGTKST